MFDIFKLKPLVTFAWVVLFVCILTVTPAMSGSPYVPSDPIPSDGVTWTDLYDFYLMWDGGDPDGDTVMYTIYFDGICRAATYDTFWRMYDTLEPNSDHTWQVVATDSAGGVTSGPVWSFTTREDWPPFYPCCPQPSNGATGVNMMPTLSWKIYRPWPLRTGCDPDPGDTVKYVIKIDGVRVGETDNLSCETTYLSWKVPPQHALEPGKTHTWKVVAHDSYGEVTAGPEWSFTTAPPGAPYTPSNPSPANGATDVSCMPTLSWTGGGDPNGDNVTFIIKIDGVRVAETEYNSWKVPINLSLAAGATHTWKVVAKDSTDQLTPGPLWSFTTVPPGAPYVPSNPSPANGATGVKMLPKLSWTGGDPNPGDTVKYIIKIDGERVGKTVNTYFKVPILDDAMEPNTYHSWRVLAVDSTGQVTRSWVWGFITGSYPWITGLQPYSGSFPAAKPGYTVWINGNYFGTTPGSVKLINPVTGSSRLIGTYAYGSEFGYVSSWSDTQIIIRLPFAIYWGSDMSLPAEYRIRVKSADGTWSNRAYMYIGW